MLIQIETIKDLLVYAFFVGVLTLSLWGTMAVPANSNSEATVGATVTIQEVSVSVSDGAVTYGTQETSTTVDTTTGGVDDSQTATNDGNVTEDFNIRGHDTASWTLASSAGSDQYFHNFCTSSCDSSPTWSATSTTYQTLATGVASGDNQIFDLQLGTPTSTSDFTQQNTDITVQAVAQ